MMTGTGTNTYLVGRDERAVIDPGPDDPAHIQAILAAGGGRIRQILCTHTHSDHTESAAKIASLTGASLVGMSSPNTAHDDPLVLDRVVADGDSIDVDGISLRTVFTPGHASNHVCFLIEGTGMLFTGDHIMQGSTVVIWPPDGNMKQYLDSLERLHGVSMKILAPGHGYLIGDPHAEVDRLVQHRLRREQKVRAAMQAARGSATLEMLLPQVYADVPETLHAIAAQSLQAHLEKLVEDAEVDLIAGRYVSK
jgi:glyoxylase-like metal-dependent hydrolase (beta-lactamase superfamily II)